jgi:WD40 repeat protein
LEIRQISEKSLGNQYWVLGESPGAFTFSNGGKLLATVNHTEDYSHDIVVIRRTNDLSIVQSMDIDKDNSVEVLNFDPSGQELLILLSKGKLVSLSINDGSSEIIDKYPQGIASHISGFATSPDKKSFVIITWDGTIRIYHQDKPPILISEGWSSFANNIKYEAAMFPVIDWSSNGELLAVSANNNSIVIFDANKQTILCSLSGTSKDITDLEFSPDGSLLASTSYDGTIRLWGIP